MLRGCCCEIRPGARPRHAARDPLQLKQRCFVAEPCRVREVRDMSRANLVFAGIDAAAELTTGETSDRPERGERGISRPPSTKRP